MLDLLTTAALLTLAPQSVPAPSASPQMRYVDFSKDLGRPGVSAVVGRLGKLKEGRRERLKEARLGGGGTQMSVSGTQYWKVPVRARIADPVVLLGPEPGGRLDLAFDLQVARLPDGGEHRQSMTGNGAALADDALALWVVERPRKGRRCELLHVIPFHPKADAARDGRDETAVFTANMTDFCAVNNRVAELRRVLAATKDPKPDGLKRAVEELRAVTKDELEMNEPKHDVLVRTHVAPLRKRALARIAELEHAIADR